MEKDKRDQNLHTIKQIKDSGNRIFTQKGESGLATQRGKTITYWIEKEPGYYYPYHARTID